MFLSQGSLAAMMQMLDKGLSSVLGNKSYFVNLPKISRRQYANVH
jgi:hypothetical protein